MQSDHRRIVRASELNPTVGKTPRQIPLRDSQLDQPLDCHERDQQSECPVANHRLTIRAAPTQRRNLDPSP